MKIYTRTGDGGDTGLYGGERRSKSDPRIESYGELDELQAALGLARSETNHKLLQEHLLAIQMDCFVICSELARTETRPERNDPVLEMASCRWLEEQIDRLDEQLPALRAFIVPGGSRAGATLHLARAVCRRAERAIVRLADLEPVSEVVRVYLNRLSDYLFTAARTQNQADHCLETEWKARKPKE
jgi:cob(I)alamin adenosyltransferase